LPRALHQFHKSLDINLATHLGEPAVDRGVAKRDFAFRPVVRGEQFVGHDIACLGKQVELRLEMLR